MADPLSIAGLVTGVVSLGIQLHNDLKMFLDIVKNRDEDIAKLTRQAATMAQALDAIDRSLQNSDQANTGVVQSAAIVPLLDASRQELLLLQQEVASLTRTSKGQKLKGLRCGRIRQGHNAKAQVSKTARQHREVGGGFRPSEHNSSTRPRCIWTIRTKLHQVEYRDDGSWPQPRPENTSRR